MIGSTHPLERLGKGQPIHAERLEGLGSPIKAVSRKAQAKIDMCVDHCPWPNQPIMCGPCGGDPKSYKNKMATAYPIGPMEHAKRAMIMWLEWRVKQPDNPDPSRTRAILKGVRDRGVVP